MNILLKSYFRVISLALAVAIDQYDYHTGKNKNSCQIELRAGNFTKKEKQWAFATLALYVATIFNRRHLLFYLCLVLCKPNQTL